METYATVLSYAIPGFIVLTLIESIASKLMGMKVNRAMDTISSFSSGMTNTLKNLVGLSVIIISYEWMVDKMAIFNIESTIALYLLAFIGLDFVGYWSHRFNHTVNAFWNRHIIHHSSEEFNLACALRQNISAIVSIYFFLYIPMAIIGIPATVVAVVAPLHFFAQFWYHTRLINRMGFLEHIIVTPSHHRVHHAINDIYIDKNYSEIFIIWDKLFGTFQEELKNEPPVYGTLKPANTWNPILINFMHIWQIAKDAWRTKNWWDKVRIWFMPTGWRPDDVKEKYPIQSVTDVHNRPKYTTSPSKLMIGWSWAQFVLNFFLMYYMLVQFGALTYEEIVWYVSFLFLSIFAFTTMMDKHWLAVPIEVFKTIIGGAIIYYIGDWFHADSFYSGVTLAVIIYLGVSLLSTFYLYFADVKKVNLSKTQIAR